MHSWLVSLPSAIAIFIWRFYGMGMQIVIHAEPIDIFGLFLLDAFDMRMVVMGQFAGVIEDPGNLEEAEAHKIRAKRDRQIDNPHWNLKIGGSLVGM
jgi:hypothetical protein